MNKFCALLCVTLWLAAPAVGASRAAAADPSGDHRGDDLVTTIIGLVSDKDKDLRNVGLEQVREQAKGAAATERFAALLPKLSPEAQVGLLGALAERGDAAARPAAVAALASREEPVHLAAIAALGPLGQAADVPPLVQLLIGGSKAEKKAARASLVRLPGRAVSTAVDAALQRQTPAGRVALIGVLVDRRATGSTASLLAATADADPAVRTAAVTALGQLATADRLPELVRLVLKTAEGPQREAVERAVMLVCNRSAEPKRRAQPLLVVMDRLGEDERTALLPALGRVGGPAALKIVEAALAEQPPAARGRPAGPVQLARRLGRPAAPGAGPHGPRGLRAGRGPGRPDPRRPPARQAPRRPEACAAEAGHGPGHPRRGAAADYQAHPRHPHHRCPALRAAIHGPAPVRPDGVRDRGRAGPSQGAPPAAQGRVRQGPGQGDQHQPRRRRDRSGQSL